MTTIEIVFLISKLLGSSAQSRATFFQLGFGKALLLDQLLPDWNTRYFAPGVWLDDLLKTALGRSDEIPAIKVGVTASDFNLISLDGTKVSLGQLKGKVVLLDFWQTWCVPCVEKFRDLRILRADSATKDLWSLATGLTSLLRFC